MEYILTAPYSWYGGTELFMGDKAIEDSSEKKFKINFSPIRAGKNSLNPKLNGVTVRCSNCNF